MSNENDAKVHFLKHKIKMLMNLSAANKDTE